MLNNSQIFILNVCVCFIDCLSVSDFIYCIQASAGQAV